MQLDVNGQGVFAGTGGKPFDPDQPVVVLLHGAGMDHTAWALQDRYLAHHGHSVLAPDLPGHGQSGGAPLASIVELADWTVALMTAAGAAKARLVGHSMGSLIALEAAARHPERVAGLTLIGSSVKMAVGPDLLKAAESNDHDAIDMVSIWGLGPRAELGGCLAPGLWMHGGAQRLLEKSRPGVLYADLAACDAYEGALQAAAQVKVPTTVVVGGRDMMTPAKAGQALAAAISGCRTVLLEGAGHMMMSERPDEVLAAMR